MTRTAAASVGLRRRRRLDRRVALRVDRLVGLDDRLRRGHRLRRHDRGRRLGGLRDLEDGSSCGRPLPPARGLPRAGARRTRPSPNHSQANALVVTTTVMITVLAPVDAHR